MWIKLRSMRFLLLCLIAISYPALSQPFSVDFEVFANKTAFTKTSWRTEGFTVPWVDGFDQSRAFVDTAFAHAGKQSLKISYPKGGFGPSETGAQAPLQVPPADQYFVSYWLRFSEDFSWGTTSYGGKLPGLGSGENCSGCTTCTGTNGFSTRLMWRTAGRGVLYLYDMDKKESCGDDYQLKGANNTDFYFQKGKWHQVVERVKINTGSNHDGEVELWMDGQHSLLLVGLQFVNNGSKVDNFYFSTFHGGSTVDWAPTNDCSIWFDDIVVSTRVSDVFSPLTIGATPSFTSNMVIGPQPVASGGYLTVKGLAIKNTFAAELLDSSGRMVATLETSQGKVQVPKVKAGMYYLRLYGQDLDAIKKIVIQ